MVSKSLHSPANNPPANDDLAAPHYVGHRQRLKDKFNDRGGGALADYELLELLLFNVIPRNDTKPLAKTLLANFGGLMGVLSAPEVSLREIKGVGQSVVHLLKLSHSLLGRALAHEIQSKPVLENWEQVIDYCTTTMGFEDKEQLRILFLDQRNQILADEVQQTGTVNHTAIYPREVMKRALEVGAVALILVHNHPSGDPTPSQADIDLTLKIQRIGDELGIHLHDHIIVGKGRHASLRQLLDIRK